MILQNFFREYLLERLYYIYFHINIYICIYNVRVYNEAYLDLCYIISIQCEILLKSGFCLCNKKCYNSILLILLAMIL